jgi:hypothetical protein
MTTTQNPLLWLSLLCSLVSPGTGSAQTFCDFLSGTGFTCMDSQQGLNTPQIQLGSNAVIQWNGPQSLPAVTIIGPGNHAIITRTSHLTIGGLINATDTAGIGFVAPTLSVQGAIQAPIIQLIASQPTSSVISKVQAGFTTPQTWQGSDFPGQSLGNIDIRAPLRGGGANQPSQQILLAARRATSVDTVITNRSQIISGNLYVMTPHSLAANTQPTSGMENRSPGGLNQVNQAFINDLTTAHPSSAFSVLFPNGKNLEPTEDFATAGPSLALQGLQTTPATVVLPSISASATHLNAVRHSNGEGNPSTTTSPNLAQRSVMPAPKSGAVVKATDPQPVIRKKKQPIIRGSIFGTAIQSER